MTTTSIILFAVIAILAHLFIISILQSGVAKPMPDAPVAKLRSICAYCGKHLGGSLVSPRVSHGVCRPLCHEAMAMGMTETLSPASLDASAQTSPTPMASPSESLARCESGRGN